MCPPNSYVEILNPVPQDMTVFGNGSLFFSFFSFLIEG